MCLDRQRVMTDLIAEDPHVAFAIKEVILLFVFYLFVKRIGFFFYTHFFFQLINDFMFRNSFLFI